MIFVLLRLKFLICISLLLTIYLQEAECDNQGLGDSSCILCMVAATCGLTNNAPLDIFSDSCSSFVFEHLSFNDDHQLMHYDEENAKYLDTLENTGKKLYTSIGHENYTQWTKILDCNGQNAIKDANGINAFISHHPGIKGLLFRKLQPDPDSEKIAGYNENLFKYFETVKRKTGLEIALLIYTYDFLDYHENPCGPSFNFTVLNPCVDFYIFRLFNTVDDCTASLRNGTLPIDGNEKYTLEKLKAAIQASQIPKEKIYFNPLLTPRSVEYLDYTCEVNYQAMCAAPEKAEHWCADTQETYFEKGQWFHQNGAGFIGSYIDFDDPDSTCKCGPFPSFNAILAGFNGTSSINTCPLFDRFC